MSNTSDPDNVPFMNHTLHESYSMGHRGAAASKSRRRAAKGHCYECLEYSAGWQGGAAGSAACSFCFSDHTGKLRSPARLLHALNL